MRGLGLHTVCEEARCPNIGECWHHGTATFMILGDVCTRACGYCAVAHGKPATLDLDEPRRVADAVKVLGLSYVVITSVDRDDLPDGGSGIFAETIRRTRELVARVPHRGADPGLPGQGRPLHTVLDAGPDVLNHNTETVPRLYRQARCGGKYARTLELLERASVRAATSRPRRDSWSASARRSRELVEVFRDLRGIDVDILTLGQYLRPTESHLQMTRYYTPDEFRELKPSRSTSDSDTSRRVRSCAVPTTRTSRPTASRRPPPAAVASAPRMPRAYPAQRPVPPRLRAVHAAIIDCDACPRLRTYCRDIATIKRAAFRDETYWARPVPGFGDATPGCSCSASRPRPMAPTAPDACSPAMA